MDNYSDWNDKAQAPVNEKNAFLALIFSFFIPGLGQVYNGDLWKGIAYLVTVPLGLLFLIIPGVVVWIWGMYDAYTEAEKMNRKELPYRKPASWEVIVFLLFPFIVGAVLLLFTTIALMAINFVDS